MGRRGSSALGSCPLGATCVPPPGVGLCHGGHGVTDAQPLCCVVAGGGEAE